MKHAWTICTLLLSLAATVAPHGQGQGPSPTPIVRELLQDQPEPGRTLPTVVLRFERNIDPSALTIYYYLTGPFGGLAQSADVPAQTWDHAITTSINKQPARRLRAYAYAPGYGYQLVDLDLTAGPPTRVIPIVFSRLGTVRLAGRVVRASDAGPETRGQTRPEDLAVSAAFWSLWHCRFLDLSECMSGPRHIASAPIAPDGSFALDIPDFARDPALARFPKKGELTITLGPAEDPYSLRGEGRVSLRLPVSDSYAPLTLIAP